MEWIGHLSGKKPPHHANVESPKIKLTMKRSVVSPLLFFLMGFMVCQAQVRPFFIDQPQNVLVQDSNATLFAFTAGGTPAPTYQWQEFNSSWTDLSNTGVYSGAVSNALNISNTAGLTSRLYRCKITNASGGDTSQVVKIVSHTLGSMTLSSNDGCGADTFYLSGAAGADSIVWFLDGVRVERSAKTGYASEGTTVATASQPYALFLDNHGNIFFTEQSNARIQKWLPGAATGITVAGGNGIGSASNQLYFPFGVCVDDTDNVYVSNYQTSQVSLWRAGADTGIAVAGGNGYGAGANQLSNTYGIALDDTGNLIVTDLWNHRVQKWTPGSANGITVAGGNGEGSGLNQLRRPRIARYGPSGDLYVGDGTNWRIMKWAPGAVTGTQAFSLPGNPIDIWLDQDENLFVVMNGDQVEKWAPGATSGVTVAGGNGAGSGTNQLSGATGVTVDPVGNLYIVDAGNSRIQRWEALEDTVFIPSAEGSYTAKVYKGAAQVTSNAIGRALPSPVIQASCLQDTLTITGLGSMIPDSVVWYRDGIQVERKVYEFASTGTKVTGTGLVNPVDVAVDSTGFLYVITMNTFTKWDQYTGAGVGTYGSMGSGAANFYGPGRIDLDNAGNIYVFDYGNARIQKWVPGAGSGTTVAGGNGSGNGNDQLNSSSNYSGIYIDDTSNIYIPDWTRIQQWAPGANTGITLAGGAGIGSNPDQLYYPSDITLDEQGNMYVLDRYNNRIQKFSPGSTAGTAGVTLTEGFGNAGMSYPNSFARGEAGIFFISDDVRVIMWDPETNRGTTVAGGNVAGSGMNQLSNARAMTMDDTGNLYIADYANHRIQKWARRCPANHLPEQTGVYSVKVYKGSCMYQSPDLLIDTSFSMNISVDKFPACAGDTLHFSVNTNIPSGTHQWYKNNVAAGTDTTFALMNPATGDQVRLELSAVCGTRVNSDTLSLFVQQPTAVTITNRQCATDMLRLGGALWADSIHWFGDNIQVARSQNGNYTRPTRVVAGGNGQGFGANQFSAPVDMVIDSDKTIYVLNRKSNQDIQLVRWRPGDTNGEVLYTAVYGSVNSLFNANCLYRDNSGSFYIGSHGTVSRWTPGDQDLVTVAGGNGTGTGLDQLHQTLYDITMDDSGYLFISDYSNARIMKWMPGAPSGVVAAGGNGFGQGLHQLYGPRHVMVDDTGNVYVSEVNSIRVVKWAPGAGTGTLFFSGVTGLRAMTMDDSGYFYLYRTTGLVERRAYGAGSGVTVAGGNGTGSALNQLSNLVVELGIDGVGDIYAMDYQNYRVTSWKQFPQDTTFLSPGSQVYATVFDKACAVRTTPSVLDTRVQWTGAQGTSWTDTSNWLCRVLPVDTNNITVNTGAPNMPVITDSRELHSLTINTGASLTLSGPSAFLETDSVLTINGGKLILQDNTLSITGDFVTQNGGSLKFNGQSSLSIEGSGTVDTLYVDQTNDDTSNTLVDLTVNRNGQNIVLANKLQVTGVLNPIAGIIRCSDTLVLKAVSATSYGQIAPHGSNTIIGTLVAEKFISESDSAGWRQIGIPLNISNLNSLTGIPLYFENHNDASQRNIYYWDAGNGGSGLLAMGWKNANHTTHNNTRAYTVFGGTPFFGFTDRRIQASGTESNGDVVFSLYNYIDPDGSGIAAEGWNLIPNPYPSRIKVATLLNSSEFSSALDYTAIHVWDGLNGQYKAITADAITNYNTSIAALDTSIDLAPFQAFWVKANANTTFTLTNDHRTVTGNPGIFMKKSHDLCRLNVFDTDSSWDQVVVYFKDGATTGFDTKADAFKLFSTLKNVPSLYAPIPGVNLAISALPYGDESYSVPLGFRSSKKGTHHFDLVSAELDPTWEVSLEDLLLKKNHNLRHGAYSFEPTANTEGRFILHFHNKSTGMNEPEKADATGIRISCDQEQVFVNVSPGSGGVSTVIIYDMLGKEVFRMNDYLLAEGFVVLPAGTLGTGAYVVKVQTSTNVASGKIIIKK